MELFHCLAICIQGKQNGHTVVVLIIVFIAFIPKLPTCQDYTKRPDNRNGLLSYDRSCRTHTNTSIILALSNTRYASNMYYTKLTDAVLTSGHNTCNLVLLLLCGHIQTNHDPMRHSVGFVKSLLLQFTDQSPATSAAHAY